MLKPRMSPLRPAAGPARSAFAPAARTPGESLAHAPTALPGMAQNRVSASLATNATAPQQPLSTPQKMMMAMLKAATKEVLDTETDANPPQTKTSGHSAVASLFIEAIKVHGTEPSSIVRKPFPAMKSGRSPLDKAR